MMKRRNDEKKKERTESRMGILEQIGKRRFAPGKGVTELPPQKGVKRFFFLLTTHFWRFIRLNMLFVLFCLPVVTIPAALCGMNRVMITLVRDGNCFLWSEFSKEFKANLIRSLPFGILFTFLMLDAYFFFNIAAASGSPGMNILAGAAGCIILGFAVLFNSYVFVLLPTLALTNRFIAKNASILMLTEWKTSLLILACTLFMAFITAAFFPFTIILLVFILFSFTQLLVCTAVNEPLQRRIIGPFEQMQREEVQG